MKFKQISKTITFSVAVLWISCLTVYGCFLIGTLAHELMHKHYSVTPKAIEVDYDISGRMIGVSFSHSHDYVYLSGGIVTTTMICITAFSLILIMMYSFDIGFNVKK